MTDQEIKDIIKKGGPGSGRKGHTGVTPDKSTRERNRQKAGDALQTSKEAKRIIAELDLGKEDLKEIRDLASAEGITPSQFVVNNKDHIKTNFKNEAHNLMSQMKAPGVGSMAKGGPGSGKKGSKHDAEVEAKEKEEHGASLKDKFANLQSTWDKMNKGPLVTAARSALRSPGAGKGSDKVPGGPGGPSAAAGGGTGKGTGGSMPMISKGGPGSGRRGHFTEDGEDHVRLYLKEIRIIMGHLKRN